MAQTRRLLCFVLVSLYCLTHSVLVIASDDGLSSKIDSDIFLDDDIGSGSRGIDDLEISGSGNGFDDDDEDRVTVKPHPPNTTPKSSKQPEENNNIGRNTEDQPGDDLGFPNGEGSNNNGIFHVKDDNSPSLFSQPGILAAIVFGCIFGILVAILVVMFVVYRMRKADEGSYVLDNESKRATQSYGKSKEFFA